eukprot:Lithocolla_globosa_v1_NODE_144_length_5725_cov_14.152028.p6 type:complete len:104 gc:universal NODE_144_length_5725_cov_14.152028:5144-5455(+)
MGLSGDSLTNSLTTASYHCSSSSHTVLTGSPTLNMKALSKISRDCRITSFFQKILAASFDWPMVRAKLDFFEVIFLLLFLFTTLHLISCVCLSDSVVEIQRFV